jgi:predicted nucleic acid-binding protein
MDGLVDASVVVDMLRGHPPAVNWGQTNRQLTLGITPIAWLETVAGAKSLPKQRQTVRFLSIFSIVYLTEIDFDWAMQQFTKHRLSHGVDVLDALIAAPAHRLTLPLCTTNLKHFTPLLGTLAVRPY